jgi:hypothetical protein
MFFSLFESYVKSLIIIKNLWTSIIIWSKPLNLKPGTIFAIDQIGPADIT